MIKTRKDEESGEDEKRKKSTGLYTNDCKIMFVYV